MERLNAAACSWSPCRGAADLHVMDLNWIAVENQYSSTEFIR